MEMLSQDMNYRSQSFSVANQQAVQDQPGERHILVVDDDEEIRDLLGRFLNKHGYRVTTARDGEEMWKVLASNKADLVILDVMLPGDDGLMLCRRLRETSQISVIMLTAMGDETDRIIGLEIGADDYLPKPFNPRELLARAKAVLRRAAAASAGARGNIAKFAGWNLDFVKRELTSPDGAVTELTGGEYDLLMAFVEHPQRVLTRDQLLDFARGRTASSFDRSIDVQVSRLRRKLEGDPSRQTLIKTVRGAGYIFVPKVERL
jgi:two-component system OmpR family response regulator